MTPKAPTAAELAEEIKRLALPFHYDEGRRPIERRMSRSELRLCELIGKLAAMAKAAEGAPDGWRLVPIEMTKEMLDAVATTLYDELSGSAMQDDQIRDDWRAMLDAAPQAPQRGSE